VCGSRDWTDTTLIYRWLSLFDPDTIIEGEARGADQRAAWWAFDNNVPCMRFPAEWKKYGKAAGPIRNKQMLDEGKPDLVLAFHDDIENSKGTADMVEQARKRDILRLVVSHGV